MYSTSFEPLTTFESFSTETANDLETNFNKCFASLSVNDFDNDFSNTKTLSNSTLISLKSFSEVITSFSYELATFSNFLAYKANDSNCLFKTKSLM
ncbi:Uncharacterised protein [Mycoplasmopsis edwardii]|uniref:Uncharacterized protein n=1 Tax=Mycoplasmopsis edwardii TaxID=53558 RepID=A0A3B0PM69_9BACT|nr:Uncharacterised protein [Mycoplasmopsis edwardii]